MARCSSAPPVAGLTSLPPARTQPWQERRKQEAQANQENREKRLERARPWWESLDKAGRRALLLLPLSELEARTDLVDPGAQPPLCPWPPAASGLTVLLRRGHGRPHRCHSRGRRGAPEEAWHLEALALPAHRRCAAHFPHVGG